MASEIDIVNLALTKLGVNSIASFADGTRQAGVAKLWYPRSRNALLRSHPWNWARTFLPLPMANLTTAQMAFSPDPWYQSEIIFTAAYQIPPDCVRVYRAAPYQYHFRIVGTLLYTDAPSSSFNNSSFVGAQPGSGLPPIGETVPATVVGIEYISKKVDTNLFDDMFIECLATRLAGHMCIALNGNLQTKANIETEAAALTEEAWFADGAEQWPDGLYDNTLANVRNQDDGWLGGVFSG